MLVDRGELDDARLLGVYQVVGQLRGGGRRPLSFLEKPVSDLVFVGWGETPGLEFNRRWRRERR